MGKYKTDYEDSESKQARLEEQRLQKMSLEELKVELDARLKEKMIEEIRTLSDRIDRHMDSAAAQIICASLGIKKDSFERGRWVIDFSSEKASALAVALGEHALKHIEACIPDFLEGLLTNSPKIPPLKSAYNRAFKEKFGELLNDELWKRAHAHANKKFEEIIEKIAPSDDLKDVDD